MKSDLVSDIYEDFKGKGLYEICEKLPIALEKLSEDERVELVSELLCEEWYTNQHYDYIKKVLEILINSFKNE